MIEPDDQTDELPHTVIGAAIDLHRTLGPGYLESVYEQALAIELELRGIRFVRQCPISISYKRTPGGRGTPGFRGRRSSDR